MSDLAISVRDLRKSYGDVEAVRGISLDVTRGEIFAFLGPNGAGKTSTVEILEGYRERDGGEATVLGTDPGRANRAWRQRLGIVLQSSGMQPELTARETVAQFAGYYPHPRGVDETVALVGLAEKADTRVRRLSGGQQRRLDVALALVGDPELLFLDEPTTGFDPSARRGAWELIAGLRDLGKTVFLTTHYMDEAQALADRIAIISAGRIVAEGTPAEIGGRATADSVISWRLTPGLKSIGLKRAVGEAVEPDAKGTYRVSTAEPATVLHHLTGWALNRGVELIDLTVSRPTLEDVYLQLTADAATEKAAE